jgi:hypothetical protein
MSLSAGKSPLSKSSKAEKQAFTWMMRRDSLSGAGLISITTRKNSMLRTKGIRVVQDAEELI